MAGVPMRFDIITLFPELFEPFLKAGVTRRAFADGHIEVHFWNPRDFAQGQYRRVDDRPFGGGPGMVMQAQPLELCLSAIRAQHLPDAAAAPVVYFSPIGKALTHEAVQGWADRGGGAVLLCGRYEGIDQRWIDRHVTLQISLGDFVLSGGEIAALAFLDAIARLCPGVLNDAESHLCDSFNAQLDGLLDSPHYTRPEVWSGQSVPPELMSGNHQRIALWRRQQSLKLTAQARADLIDAARLAGRLSVSDETYLRTLKAD